MLTRKAALSRTYLRLFLVFTAVYLVVYALSQWTQTSAGLDADRAGPRSSLLRTRTAVTSRPNAALIAERANDVQCHRLGKRPTLVADRVGRG
jgi:hypothetical protein